MSYNGEKEKNNVERGTLAIVLCLIFGGAILIQGLLDELSKHPNTACLVTQNEGKQVSLAIDAALDAAHNH
ncbi:MAG: hypothetical protein AAB372_03405 [Patescibacteria group bacterium]